MSRIIKSRKINEVAKFQARGFFSIKAGFSLIEVLITLMVLSIGITAISALMASNIKTSVTAKNQIIASGLAQEGVELVRNLKENNPDFVTGVAIGEDYRIDTTTPYLTFKTKFVTDSLKKLNLDGGIFSHSAGTATKFLREIKVSTVGSNKKVESLVSWNGASIPAVCNVANKCVSVQAVFPGDVVLPPQEWICDPEPIYNNISRSSCDSDCIYDYDEFCHQ